MVGEEIDYSPQPKRKDSPKEAPLSPAPRKGTSARKGGKDAERVGDYAPRPERRPRRTQRAGSVQSERNQGGKDGYAPRPARQERTAARPATRKRTTVARKRSKRKKGRITGSKVFWRFIAVGAVAILVVPTVLVAILDQGPSATQDPEVAALLNRLERDPADLDALISLGNYYFEQGTYWWDHEDARQALKSFESAAAYYKSALRLVPADTGVRTDLGTMLYYQGQLQDNPALVEQAIQEWQVALSYEPDKPETLFNLGIGFIALDQTEQALVVWQRVIEVAPGSAHAEDAQRMLAQYGGP